MFYVKNIPCRERTLRIFMGLVGLGFAIINWNVSGWAVSVGIASALLSMTGLFGFCPMCALAGRKLDKRC